jgi:hypothetical protein
VAAVAVLGVGGLQMVVMRGVVGKWGNHVHLLKIYRNKIYRKRFFEECKVFFGRTGSGQALAATPALPFILHFCNESSCFDRLFLNILNTQLCYGRLGTFTCAQEFVAARAFGAGAGLVCRRGSR